MILDRSTYEAWLLDRLEGNLTPQQERELDAFLAAHPDLPATLDDLLRLTDDTAVFQGKEGLKRTYPPTGIPDAARLDDFLTARSEGDLQPEQLQQLERYLYEHPEEARAAKLIAAAYVEGGDTAYPNKATLQKHFPPQGLPDKQRLTDFLIAAVEGDLTQDQVAALKDLVDGDAEAMREQRLTRATRVAPDVVVFAGKAGLKKHEARVITLWPRLAAAASAVLLLGLAAWYLRGDAVDKSGVARVEWPKSPSPEQHTVPPTGTDTPETENPSRTPSAGVKETTSPAPEQERSGTPPASLREGAPQENPSPAEVPAERHLPQVPPSPAPVAPMEMEDPGTELAQAEQPPGTATAPPTPGGSGSTNTLGTLVANVVRNEVLETAERPTDLDRHDATAMVDKGLSAITGGEGGMTVQRTKARERVQLRFGRNLAITASRGR